MEVVPATTGLWSLYFAKELRAGRGCGLSAGLNHLAFFCTSGFFRSSPAFRCAPITESRYEAQLGPPKVPGISLVPDMALNLDFGDWALPVGSGFAVTFVPLKAAAYAIPITLAR